MPYVAKRKDHYYEKIQVPHTKEYEKSWTVYDNEDYTVDQKIPYVEEGSKDVTRYD